MNERDAKPGEAEAALEGIGSLLGRSYLEKPHEAWKQCDLDLATLRAALAARAGHRVEYGQVTYGTSPSMRWELYHDGLPIGMDFALEAQAAEAVKIVRDFLSLAGLAITRLSQETEDPNIWEGHP